MSPEYIESKILTALSLSKGKGRDETVIRPLTDWNAKKEAKTEQDFCFVSYTAILKVYHKKETSRTLNVTGLNALVNARFTKLQRISSTPYLSTCQLIDSKSILNNKNSVFFSFTLKYVWLTYANHNFLPRVLVRYSNRLAKKTKVLLRSLYIDSYPRYAIFYVN